MINLSGILHYNLVKTTRRLTFDIIYQADVTRFKGEDDEDYFMFVASNGYQIISRSRMDIQTERLWLLGGKSDESSIRSGTMIFSSDEKRDAAYEGFTQALKEWANYVLRNTVIDGKPMTRLSDYVPLNRDKAVAWKVTCPFANNIITESEQLAQEHAHRFHGKITPLYE